MKKEYTNVNEFISASKNLKKSVALDNPKAPKLTYARSTDYTKLPIDELFVCVAEVGNMMKEQFISVLFLDNKPMIFKTTRLQETVFYYRHEMQRIEMALEKSNIIFDSYPVSKYTR